MSEADYAFPDVFYGASALLREAQSFHSQCKVLEILKQIESDPFVAYTKGFYERGLGLCGGAWGYADVLTALFVASWWLRPERYMEIGVFRGRSTCIVAHTWPDVAIAGFDSWTTPYAGLENRGPEAVHRNLDLVGHKGARVFVPGNSRRTVLENTRPRSFDLILVDGGHEYQTAMGDLANAIDRVKPGGVIVCDDLGPMKTPWVAEAWDKLFSSSPQTFSTAKHTETGNGVGVAVRR